MNYVGLMGRLTRDPELKQTASGKKYCRFSIAVKKDFVKDGVDFINCVAWDNRAETIARFFSKGHRIVVQGRINTGSYEVNGEKRTSFDVVVSQIDFVEPQGYQPSNSNGSFSQPEPEYSGNDDMEDDGPLDEEFPF